ncbi:MAG: multidrug efflux RND transporter permease subunit [Alphaproteobacteria bacterium]|nr:multidrug efflux RND transporter permease subunit [Alphaproteobacteria bacterium]
MISRVFIERPRLAIVLALVISMAGALAMVNLPVAQFPNITPPVVQVTASYPGADAETVAETVAAPIEAQVNGVDGMLYMSSVNSNNGNYTLSVTFAVGTDPDLAQVNVQNRVQLANPRLPDEVTAQGVKVEKSSPSFLHAINFYSPDNTRDQLFVSNYVSITIRDAVARIPGIGSTQIFGEQTYSMRIWLDPDRMANLGIDANEVMAAIRSQNQQASAGQVGAPPTDSDQAYQYTVRAQGRLKDAREFERIIIRTNEDGGIVRVSDVAEVELGAQSYESLAEWNGSSTVVLATYLAPGANALDTSERVRELIAELSENFPEGVAYDVTYDTTLFVERTIDEIVTTLGITFIMVSLVTFIFLQNVRITLVPVITIPVSLIGVFAILLVLGYSANTVTLFALILAVGLVVDDAIVVVENVQRLMEEEGLDRKAAAIKAMQQVTGPVIATTLVLLAVFGPVALLPGITGQLYEQFAVTLSGAVVISSINALTLSPALCATILPKKGVTTPVFLKPFEMAINGSRSLFVAMVQKLLRVAVISLVVVGGAGGLSAYLFGQLPTSFLPIEDQGYFFADVQLPPAASLIRTDAAADDIREIIQDTPGVKDVITFSGFSLIAGTSVPRSALIVVVLEDWDERMEPQEQLFPILGSIGARFNQYAGANSFAFPPPPIQGLGNAAGFDLRLQALQGQNSQELASTLNAFLFAANQSPIIGAAYSTYSANTPQIFVDIDREKAYSQQVTVNDIFGALQANFGAIFVNDFNLLGRVYQVRVQAEEEYRDSFLDITRIHVRNALGQMVPLSTLATVETVFGPEILPRYNQYSSATVNGQAAPGYSSGDAIAELERIAAEVLPEGYGYEWSALSYQEKQQGSEAIFIFALAILFAYLFLVGQYESWTVPLPVMVSVAVAVMGATLTLMFTGIGSNIYTQIGLVLLIGLASKNAILIVEFARVEREEHGRSIVDAALNAARMRYRAVLMTALSFVFGVIPLVIAEGAGAASRMSIGWTVLGGMVAATFIGILLIPGLYVCFQWLRETIKRLLGMTPRADLDARPGE